MARYSPSYEKLKALMLFLQEGMGGIFQAERMQLTRKL